MSILIEDMEKLRNGLFTNGYFNVGDDGEINTNKVFKDSYKIAKFTDKIVDKYKYDDHPCIYYTGKSFRYLKNFKRVNRSEH